jgi:hypothetical protein
MLIVRKLTGKAEGPARGLLGKWAQAAGDDDARLLVVLRDAEAKQPAKPEAWITAALQQRQRPPEARRSQTDRARAEAAAELYGRLGLDDGRASA